jgi:hypothetical protein
MNTILKSSFVITFLHITITKYASRQLSDDDFLPMINIHALRGRLAGEAATVQRVPVVVIVLPALVISLCHADGCGGRTLAQPIEHIRDIGCDAQK